MDKNFLNKLEGYMNKFKKMTVAKQSLIAVTAIGAIISLIGNYKNIKNTVVNIYNKYKDSENVQEFVKDVSFIVSPVTEKVKSFFKTEEVEK